MKKKLLLTTLISLVSLLLCGGAGLVLYQNWPHYEALLAAQLPPSLNTLVSTAVAPSSPPTTTDLPTPQTITPHWQTYSASERVQSIAPAASLVWVGTEGGLLALDPHTGETVHFFPEHGLPANHITAVKIAPDTAVWVATADGGVGRYDGHIWERFLFGQTVRDLALTAEGAVWAATNQGLAHYNPAVGEWTSYTSANTLLDLPTDDLTALAIVPNGLWVGSRNGLFFYDFNNTWQPFTTADGLPADDIRAVAVGPDGLVWVATPNGLGRYDGRSWRTYRTAEGLLSDDIATLGVDPSGAVWLGYDTAARGAQRLVEQEGRHTLTLFQTPEGLPDEAVTAVGIARDGQVWLGTAHGLAQRETNPDAPENETWRVFNTSAALPSNQLTDLQSVGTNLWVASRSGVSQFDGLAWTHHPVADVQALSADPTGAIWAAHRTAVQGLSRYDVVREVWEARPCVRAESSPRIYSSATQSLLITAETGAGWLGTHDGLFRLEPTAGGLRCVYQEALTQTRVNTAVRDASATSKALLATENGLWQASPTQLAPWDVALPPGRVPQLRQAIVGSDGSVWVAGHNFVARSQGAEWEIIALDALFRGEVRGLALGRDLTLYVATNKGVLRYNGQWQTLTTATGLASNDVRHLQSTPDGTIWMATSAGLSAFRPFVVDDR